MASWNSGVSIACGLWKYPTVKKVALTSFSIK